MAKVTGITKTKYCMDYWKTLSATDVNPLTPMDFTGCTLYVRKVKCELMLRFKATKAVKKRRASPHT